MYKYIYTYTYTHHNLLTHHIYIYIYIHIYIHTPKRCMHTHNRGIQTTSNKHVPKKRKDVPKRCIYSMYTALLCIYTSFWFLCM